MCRNTAYQEDYPDSAGGGSITMSSAMQEEQDWALLKVQRSKLSDLRSAQPST